MGRKKGKSGTEGEITIKYGGRGKKRMEDKKTISKVER